MRFSPLTLVSLFSLCLQYRQLASNLLVRCILFPRSKYLHRDELPCEADADSGASDAGTKSGSVTPVMVTRWEFRSGAGSSEDPWAGWQGEGGEFGGTESMRSASQCDAATWCRHK